MKECLKQVGASEWEYSSTGGLELLDQPFDGYTVYCLFVTQKIAIVRAGRLDCLFLLLGFAP